MSDSVRFDAVAVDCADPMALARFWCDVLGTEIEGTGGEGPHYVDVRGTASSPIMRFQRVPESKATKNRLHLDLLADDLEAASDRVGALGARRTGESHSEYGFDWVVLEDPEGNEFCIIREGGASGSD